MKKYIRIYAIKHKALKEEEFVLAENIEDAINKFNSFWKDDYDIESDGIETVNLFYNEEVII